MESYALIDFTDTHLHMRQITMSSLSASVPVQRLRPESLYNLTRWNSSEGDIPCRAVRSNASPSLQSSILDNFC